MENILRVKLNGYLKTKLKLFTFYLIFFFSAPLACEKLNHTDFHQGKLAAIQIMSCEMIKVLTNWIWMTRI